MKLMLCLTFDPTVALLQYSLAFVLMLLGSIVSASEYSSHAASQFPSLNALFPSSFLAFSALAFWVENSYSSFKSSSELTETSSRLVKEIFFPLLNLCQLLATELLTLHASRALSWSGAIRRAWTKNCTALSMQSSQYRQRPRTYRASALVESIRRISLDTNR